jgi:hypothetical protein
MEVAMRWFVVAMAALSLAGCLSFSSSPSPTIVVPQGATVVCPNGSPAAYSDGAYRC